MTYLLREFELACLVDLVNHVDLKETWYPLYKEWLQKEHSPNQTGSENAYSPKKNSNNAIKKKYSSWKK